jgi:hypothetical protein
MSLGTTAISESPVAAETATTSSKNKTPPGRTTTATADAVQQPQPR